ncbi:MAG: acyl-CoA dehydrogenase family protein [Flavobacteriales bacterium]|nr:acyl-CoA dehydrogenase family protein [Flavobacteriales bacterium]MDW8409760.1 acyl-CoA dehydrogenase family protein [Flavobacteriales bacterium]
MNTESATKTALKGGEWLVRESSWKDVFIPEEFDEETLLIGRTCEEFVRNEVWPLLDRLDSMQEPHLMPELLRKAGQLGMLGLSIPEEYGGFGKSFLTDMYFTEKIGPSHSFAVGISAHVGIGTLPIVLYGNEAQKAKYLPKLATGEWFACYALTEPGAGSDANAGKTKATLNAAGTHYLLNGQKIWITNSGFAEVFIVFAKIDDDENHSAFIVEKSFGGIRLGEEEKKMGIKGSSTRQVFFEDCPVPVENLLSERGNGFKIAVNILNIGRIKLAGAAVGGAKVAIDNAVAYANERHQFGKPISKYGAIQYKISEMCLRTFATESATYRATRMIEDKIAELHIQGMDQAMAKLKGVEEYAIECAMMKVYGSEALSYVVDEGVQIYGGMGYSAEMPMDRAYRDARINRIFEGTNEINRMLTVDMLMRRAMKGALDLMTPAMAIPGELMEIPEPFEPDGSLFCQEKEYLRRFKKAILLVAGSAVQKLMQNLAEEQEILMDIADMLIETYVAESTLLRVEKMVHKGLCTAEDPRTDIVRVLVHDTADRLWLKGKDALNAFAEGDELRMMMMGLKRFTKTEPFNAKEARRRIAAAAIEANKYPF